MSHAARRPHDRRAKIAAIHIGKAQLGLDDDTYRELLARVSATCGEAQRSTRDMTLPQLAAVQAEMWRLGAKQPTQRFARGRSRPAQYPGTPHNIDGSYKAKIEAQLSEMQLPWSYADAIAKRMFGLDALAWASGEQQRAVLAALHVEHEKRALLEKVKDLCSKQGLTLADLPGRFQLQAGWTRNRRALRALCEALCPSA